jgi:hypothetical protein
MQDVDRPTDVETLAEPVRGRGGRVEVEPCRLVLRAKHRHGIGWHWWRQKRGREEPTVLLAGCFER